MRTDFTRPESVRWLQLSLKTLKICSKLHFSYNISNICTNPCFYLCECVPGDICKSHLGISISIWLFSLANLKPLQVIVSFEQNQEIRSLVMLVFWESFKHLTWVCEKNQVVSVSTIINLWYLAMNSMY